MLDLAAKITAEESKDLQVVSWWIEALLRVHSFAGSATAFAWRELIEAFWEQLYPLPDEEDSSPEEPWATRVGPLAGLNGVESDGVLVNPLMNLPITAAGSLRAMSLVDFQQASDLEKIQDPARRAQRVQNGAVSLEAFQKAVAETSTEYFTELLGDVTACAVEFDKLSAALDEKCGDEAPPTSNIRNALTAVREQVEQFLRGRGRAQRRTGRYHGGGGSGSFGRTCPVHQRQRASHFPRRRLPHADAGGRFFPPHRAAVADPVSAGTSGAGGRCPCPNCSTRCCRRTRSPRSRSSWWASACRRGKSNQKTSTWPKAFTTS